MDKDLLSLVQGEVKGIIRDLALQSKQLSKLQRSVASIQDHISSEKVRMDGHAARLDFVEEKFQKDEKTRREEIEQVLRRLASIEKILSEKLLRKVQRVEEGLAATNIKVEELGQGVAKTDDRVEQLEQGFAKTNDKMTQLEQGVVKTDFKVEHLEREVKSQMEKMNVEPG